MSLRAKLIILFFTVAFIPAFTIGMLTFNKYRNSLEFERLSDMKDLVAFKMDKLETFISTLKSNIMTFQDSYFLKKILPEFNKPGANADLPEYAVAREQLDKRFKNTQSILGLAAVLILNSKGEIIYSSNPNEYAGHLSKPLVDPDGRAFSEGSKGIYITDVFFNPIENNRLELLLAAPILSDDSNLLGVIVFEMNMEPIYDIIRIKTGLGRTGEVIIAKKSGNEVLYLGPLKYDADAALKKRIKLGAAGAIPIQQAVQGHNGVGVSADYRNKEVIAAWRYLPSLGWGIVVKMDAEEAFAGIRRLWNFLIVILSSAFILAGIVSFYIASAVSFAHRELAEEVMEHKKVEDALKASERKIRAVLDQTFQFIGLMTPEGILVEANRAALNFAGLKESDILGKPFWETPWWTHSVELQIQLKEAIAKVAEGKFVRFEATHMSHNGELRYIDFSLKPVKDELGNVVMMIPEGRDITERKELERQLQEYGEDLEKKVTERTLELKRSQDELTRAEKLAMIGRLASNVAHELRNPLGVMKNVVYYLNMLDPVKDNRDVKENLDIVSQEIENSNRIISDLLEFSRTRKPDKRPENINAVAKEVLGRMHTIDPGINIELELDNSMPPVMADALQMNQVFYNMIKNALEAMEKGGGTLTIRSGLAGDFAQISFTDTGCGIAKEDIEKIYEPLFSTKTKGTGLGLSICASLVEAHGGKIEVESKPGKGTTFTVKLPVKMG